MTGCLAVNLNRDVVHQGGRAAFEWRCVGDKSFLGISDDSQRDSYLVQICIDRRYYGLL